MQQENYKKLFNRIFWSVILIPFITVILFFTLISTGNLGFMPSFEELENPKSNLASEIYSSDQVLLGKYYLQNRSVANFSDLSPYLVKALIATEDVRFYDHSGIDFNSLFRVLVKTFLLGRDAGGGSTVTQQLAKNLFPRDLDESIYLIKFKEWVVSVKLERNYTKEEIIAMYFNTVPFGSGAFGIKSAARTFFNTTPDSLKIEEAALLVGIVNGPTMFSPIPPSHPADSLRIRRQQRSIARRNIVLSQMRKYEMLPQLSEMQYDSLMLIPIRLNYRTQAHDEGMATYFREYLKSMLSAHEPVRERYTDYESYQIDSSEWTENPLYGWVLKNPKPDGNYYNIYKDGLRIYTTIDSRMQQYAESAVAEHLGLGPDPLQEAFEKDIKWNARKPFSNALTKEQYDQIMNMFIKTSERYRVYKQKDSLNDAQIMKLFNEPVQMSLFSWKGKIDTVLSPLDSILYEKRFLRAGLMSMEASSGYVKAYVGGIDFEHFKYDQVNQARRQVGSTFKPFVYAMAILDNLSPCYQVANIPWYFDKEKEKPRYSKNPREGEMVSLKYGLALSLNQISAWLINKYKPAPVVDLAKRLGIKSPIPEVPSICVGSPDIKLGEMVPAYATFLNKGVHSSPLYVTRIEDRNGNVIAKFSSRKKEVISENMAYLMVNLMQGVADYGTSVRLRTKYKLNNPIAGKTGTTNSNSDGWFMGMVPDLMTGVWVGGDLRTIRFNSSGLGQGAHMALPIWALYMQKVYNDNSLNVSKGDFPVPLNLNIQTDCAKYQQIDSTSVNNYNTIIEGDYY
jgi:penicillin-binding protein 1A